MNPFDFRVTSDSSPQVAVGLYVAVNSHSVGLEHTQDALETQVLDELKSLESLAEPNQMNDIGHARFREASVRDRRLAAVQPFAHQHGEIVALGREYALEYGRLELWRLEAKYAIGLRVFERCRIVAAANSTAAPRHHVLTIVTFVDVIRRGDDESRRTKR